MGVKCDTFYSSLTISLKYPTISETMCYIVGMGKQKNKDGFPHFGHRHTITGQLLLNMRPSLPTCFLRNGYRFLFCIRL